MKSLFKTFLKLLVLVMPITIVACVDDEDGMNPGGIVLSQYTLNVPAEGGEYTVKVKSKDKVSLEPVEKGGYTLSPIPVYTSSIYPLPEADMKIEGKKIKVTVSPAHGRVKCSTFVRIYSDDADRYADLWINQEGSTDGVLYTDYGNVTIKNLSLALWSAHSLYYTFDTDYTHLANLRCYSSPVNSRSEELQKFWSSLEWLASHSNQINDQATFASDAGLLGVIDLAEAWRIGLLAALWNNVPKVSSEGVPTNEDYVMASHKELITKARTHLERALSIIPERKGALMTTQEALTEPSKDVVRWLLAMLEMEEGDFGMAMSLLLGICNRDVYALTAETDYSPNSAETIWGVAPELLGDNMKNGAYVQDKACGTLGNVWLTYADVLLLLAECDYREGQQTRAEIIINDIATAKGIELAGSDILQQLKQLYAILTVGRGHYFLFLRRNGLAESELNLQQYQLLLPLPFSVVDGRPNVIQNPGY